MIIFCVLRATLWVRNSIECNKISIFHIENTSPQSYIFFDCPAFSKNTYAWGVLFQYGKQVVFSILIKITWSIFIWSSNDKAQNRYARLNLLSIWKILVLLYSMEFHTRKVAPRHTGKYVRYHTVGTFATFCFLELWSHTFSREKCQVSRGLGRVGARSATSRETYWPSGGWARSATFPRIKACVRMNCTCTWTTYCRCRTMLRCHPTFMALPKVGR